MEPLRPDDPRQVGPYRLEHRLGGGGMGQVYLGRSPGARPVAVKVVRPELADDADFRRRFAVEVEAARQVGGFYTAQVVDADPDANPPWLVTAYIPGPSLQQAIDAHGPLPAESVATLGAGLAEGLAAVHAAGLAHRDLKPGNVLLAADGPRVIDFGIARAMDATSHTATSQIIGTPAFMSPEQLRGGEVDQRTDVFSLGTVLVYAATAQGPFGTGPSQGIMYRIVNEEPDVSGLPAPLSELVTACLAKNPADRPGLTEIIDRLAVPAQAGTQWLPSDVTLMITKQADDANIPATGPKPTKQLTAEPAPPQPGQKHANLAIGNFSRKVLDVFVDGAATGEVPAGSQNTFAVTPGSRTVQVSAGPQAGAAQSVEVRPGGTIRLGYRIPRLGTIPKATDTVTFTRFTNTGITVSYLCFLLPICVFLAAAITDPGDPGLGGGFLATVLITAFLGVWALVGSFYTRTDLTLSNFDIRIGWYSGKRNDQIIEWKEIDQVGMVGNGRRAELIIWPNEGSSTESERVTYPIGWLTPKHSLAEIRSALRWFVGDRYVEQPR